MAYITAEDLMKFTNKISGDDEKELLEKYCKASMNKIKNYLGYNPELSTVEIKHRGDNGQLFDIKTKAFVSIEEFKINGETADKELLELSENPQYLQFADESKFFHDNVYKVTIKQGFETVPEDIVTCALQIATLYMESAGGNLAVSSTSFADTGTRVFNNFKADRFLEDIKHYRIVEFM